MGNSGVLFKRAFHPAPAVRPTPAALKRDRFDDVIVRFGSVPKPDEIATRTVEFVALREANGMPLPCLRAVQRHSVLHRPIDRLRRPFVGDGVVVPAEKLDGEVSKERMDAVDAGLGPAELDVVVREVLGQENRGDPVRARDGLENLIG